LEDMRTEAMALGQAILEETDPLTRLQLLRTHAEQGWAKSTARSVATMETILRRVGPATTSSPALPPADLPRSKDDLAA
jgi:hypothetical protein